jgi:MFS family permease
VLFYPVYALLFAETGLSAAGISSLFIVWSVTSFVVEVPSGVWADVFSRRWLLTIAPALAGAGYALWTFVPSYPAFALGFVLWGAGSALRSGALQALVYTELARVGAPDAYARLIGRSQAISTTATMIATGLAAPVFAAGGYRAVGIASVAVMVLGVGAGWRLPESRRTSGLSRSGHETAEQTEEMASVRRSAASVRGHETAGEKTEGTAGRTYAEVLRGGLAALRRAPKVRRALLFVAALAGISSLDEYIPLLAQSMGLGPAAVSLLTLLVMVGVALGGWAAGHGRRWTGPALTAAAAFLAAGAASGHPAGLVFIAAAFGIIEWAGVDADARLQESVTDGVRATVTSMAGLGAEVVAVLTFAGYALGSTMAQPGLLFTLAAAPCLLLSLAMGRSRNPKM